MHGLVAYATSQSHSSVEKGLRIAGIGTEQIRVVPHDNSYSMRPDELDRMMTQDRADGLRPFFVVATIGTTSSLAFDPVDAIADVAQAHGAWLHVDGAMAGMAALVPEYRWVNHGLDRADSYCTNPHKWMGVNFDCNLFWTRDRRALLGALSILPEYLRSEAAEAGAVIDYRDWQIPLGRRFRALKLWFVIRHYGVEGLQHHVRRHVALAQEFADWVQAEPDFELAVAPLLNLVCFRHRGGDSFNQALMDRLNASGALFLTHTRLQDRLTLRLCVGQTHTERRHVEQAWQRIRRTAAELARG